MSPMRANHVPSNLLKTPINKDSPQSYGGDSSTFRSFETMPKSSSKAFQEFQEFQPSNTKNIRKEII